jgi:hypothetical protein
LLTAAQQQRHQHAEDQQVIRAREAAEALFKPKPQVSAPPAAETAPPAEPAVRKPRVLGILPPTEVDHEAAPIAPTPPAPRSTPQTIPAKHLSRIRTWLRYGMTVPQVAALYGVAASDIERALQKG